MKLYHGSPRKLKVLVPKQAKGPYKFENRKAVFLVKDFNYAARYAISKSLKGKTSFGVGKKKLIIVGNLKPKAGYVYEVDVKAKKGRVGQYSYNKQIHKFKITKVFPKDYKKDMIFVKTKEDLMRIIN